MRAPAYRGCIPKVTCVPGLLLHNKSPPDCGHRTASVGQQPGHGLAGSLGSGPHSKLQSRFWPGLWFSSGLVCGRSASISLTRLLADLGPHWLLPGDTSSLPRGPVHRAAPSTAAVFAVSEPDGKQKQTSKTEARVFS